MSGSNDYFHRTDKHVDELWGYKIHPAWWSRKYEYPWAFQYAEFWQHAADMGCGWMDRPFKDMIADICAQVYAIDIDDRVLSLTRHGNMSLHKADFTQETFLQPESIDRVFCLSVLEDLSEKLPDALEEFKRVLQPDGLIVVTFDVWYDKAEPLGQYPGMDINYFWKSVYQAGLVPVGEVLDNKADAVFSPDFNLCCYHAVLEKA